MALLGAVQRGHRRLYLADEPGLGKTAQGCLALSVVGSRRAVVAAPVVVLETWRRELARWTPERRVEVVSGRTTHSLDPDTDTVLVGYSVVAAWQSTLAAWHLDALVMDEAHAAKSAAAARTEALIALAKSLPVDGLRIGLSGTPMPAGPKDLAPQLEILGVLGDIAASRHAFEADYCGGHYETVYIAGGGGRTRQVWKADGATTLQKLHEKLAMVCMVRRRKDDVLDLPARTVADRHLARSALAASDRQALKAAEAGTIATLTARLDSRVKRLQAESGTRTPKRKPTWDDCLHVARSYKSSTGISLTDGVREALGLAKVPVVLELVTEVTSSGRPVVVMAHHKSVQEAIAAAATEAGRTTVRVTGDQSAAEKQSAIDAFQAGAADVLVASIQSAGLGITLTAASDVVIAELPWTDAAQTQAIDRVHRIGQDRPVTAWRPVVLESMDMDIAALIDRRAAWSSATVDGAEFTEAQAVGAQVWTLAATLARAVHIAVPDAHRPSHTRTYSEYEPPAAGARPVPDSVGMSRS
ncbi:MAG: SNF2-related protein [Acidimicrobiales bacterium]